MDGEIVDFLAGGGEMGALTRGFDWSKTSLGSPQTWPQSLRVTVRLVLTSRHPMFIWWGPQLIQFYNDAYRETMGPERHPSALGAGGRWFDSSHPYLNGFPPAATPDTPGQGTPCQYAPGGHLSEPEVRTDG